MNLSKVSCILVIVLLMNSSLPSLGLFGIDTTKKNAQIHNKLGRHAHITLHCWSRSDDLGVHVLKPSEYIEWSFHDSWFSKTVFQCDVQFGNRKQNKRRQHFIVYKENGDNRGRRQTCNSKCWWEVRADGLYSLNEQYNEYTYEYPWSMVAPEPTEPTFLKGSSPPFRDR